MTKVTIDCVALTVWNALLRGAGGGNEAAPSYTKTELEAFGAGDQSYREGLLDYYARYGAAPYA